MPGSLPPVVGLPLQETCEQISLRLGLFLFADEGGEIQPEHLLGRTTWC